MGKGRQGLLRGKELLRIRRKDSMLRRPTSNCGRVQAKEDEEEEDLDFDFSMLLMREL